MKHIDLLWLTLEPHVLGRVSAALPGADGQGGEGSLCRPLGPRRGCSPPGRQRSPPRCRKGTGLLRVAACCSSVICWWSEIRAKKTAQALGSGVSPRSASPSLAAPRCRITSRRVYNTSAQFVSFSHVSWTVGIHSAPSKSLLPAQTFLSSPRDLFHAIFCGILEQSLLKSEDGEFRRVLGGGGCVAGTELGQDPVLAATCQVPESSHADRL